MARSVACHQTKLLRGHVLNNQVHGVCTSTQLKRVAENGSRYRSAAYGSIFTVLEVFREVVSTARDWWLTQVTLNRRSRQRNSLSRTNARPNTPQPFQNQRSPGVGPRYDVRMYVPVGGRQLPIATRGTRWSCYNTMTVRFIPTRESGASSGSSAFTGYLLGYAASVLVCTRTR